MRGKHFQAANSNYSWLEQQAIVLNTKDVIKNVRLEKGTNANPKIKQQSIPT